MEQTTPSVIFVCHNIEENYFRWLGEQAELQWLEEQRQQDIEDAFNTARAYPDFFEERCATDPYFPPKEFIWWEEIELELHPCL